MEAKYENSWTNRLINSTLNGTFDLYRIWVKKHNSNYNALVILYTLDDYKIFTQKQTVHGMLLDFEKKLSYKKSKPYK